jgi:hypothetical protein
VKPPIRPVYVQFGDHPRIQIGTISGNVADFGPRHWQAKALRQAADDLYGDDGPGNPLSVATWLRERADRIEQDEP